VDMSTTENRKTRLRSRGRAPESADSVPMLSVAAPLLAALRLPGSAHRRVSERAIGSGQMSMPHQDFRGRRNLKEPAIG
jgi:hypothetical protein